MGDCLAFKSSSKLNIYMFMAYCMEGSRTLTIPEVVLLNVILALILLR